MLFSNLLVSASLAAYATAQNVANKNVLFPNGLGFDEQYLRNGLPPTQSNWPLSKWAWGTLPRFCYRSAISDIFPVHHCNPYDVEVYDIKFPDCSSTWQLCRCNNSTWPLDLTVDLIGCVPIAIRNGKCADMNRRIPIKSRQYTRTFAQWPLVPASEGTQPWAYAYGPDIAIFDSPQQRGRSPTLMLHENAHTVDYGRGWLSSTTPYINAVRADSCVGDPYARSNDVENYAQLSVLGFYDLNPGPLSRFANPQCLINQLNWLKSSPAREGLQPISGGTCTFIWADEEKVCMGPAAGCGAAGAPVASLMSGSFAEPEEGVELGVVAEEELTAIVDTYGEDGAHEVEAESRMRKRKFD